MKIQNFVFLFLYPLILLLTFLFFPQKNISVSASANTKFRCASIAPPGSLFDRILQDMASKIKEKTGVEILFFSGSIIGDEIDIVRDLKNGKYDCVVSTSQSLGYISSYFAILELPFMIKNEKESDFVRKRLIKVFREILSSEGYIIGGIAEVGFDNFFSKQPMQNLKDFSGKSFWVWKGNKIHEEMYKNVVKNLGVKSVVLPIWDVEKFGSEIDIVWASPSVILAFGWTRFTRYIVEPPIGFLPAAIVIRKDKFNSIPQEAQSEIIRIIEVSTEEATLKIRKENEEAKKFMVNKLGFQITNLKDVELLERLFREYMWPVFREKYIPSWFFISVITEIMRLRTGQ
jgi:TRAP-type C4-dicarboxylate transport system substrate-binding protein